jgi:hypothetical protein
VAALGGGAAMTKRARLAAPAPPAMTAAQPSLKAMPGQNGAAAARAARPAETAPAAEAQFSLTAGKPEAQRQFAQAEEGLLSEDDDLDWDVDAVVADLSKEQQQCLKSNLESGR